MLESIRIENVALIDKLTLHLKDGLNILTGETGTGKSIIIDSINLVLGVRADKDLIKTGTEKAVVEAVFKDHSEKMKQALEKLGIEQESYVTLSREVHAAGRNIARINGTLVNNAALQEVGALLIDIHGQHEHQSLFDAKRHIGVIDSFLPNKVAPYKENYLQIYASLTEIDKKLMSFSGEEGSWERQLDVLRFQIQELESAELLDGEEEKLTQQRNLMANAEKIIAALNEAHSAIYQGEHNAFELLGNAASVLREISDISEEYKNTYEQINELYFLTEAAVDQVRLLKKEIEYDPALLDRTEKRLDELNIIKRKYGGSITQAIDFLEKAKLQREELENAAETIEKLKKQRETTVIALFEAAEVLSQKRQEVAKIFSESIMQQFADLGMKHAVFSVSFMQLPTCEDLIAEKASFTRNGLDTVEFMISTNPGEPQKPLRRIVSGGEASRIMLALKNVAADIDDIGCLIFDEIDTGISGAMAHVVAQKIATISRKRQVICVTHLAQLAAMADTHFLVQKHTDGKTTQTNVIELKPQEHLEELVRLVGGDRSSVHGKAHAQDMNRQAEEYKKSLTS